MTAEFPQLSKDGLRRFIELRSDAISMVTARFYEDHASVYAQFGERGKQACREDLGFHLEFLRPVLEFGLVAPMVEYLRWLAGVLSTRDIPGEHLSLSLDWLGEFFQARMEPSDAAVVAAVIAAIQGDLRDRFPPEPASYAKMPFAWPECTAFEEALLAGNRRSASDLIDAGLERGEGLIAAELHIIQPALYSIGQKWQRNEVSVAQEHLATAIAQSVMVQKLPGCVQSPPNGKKVLLACVEGNHHNVGLQMVSDGFLLDGWEVGYLGADVPTSSLVQYAGDWKPDLIGLSVSFAQQLQAAKTVISRLAESFGQSRPAVMVGGLAINNFDWLAGQIGADAWRKDAEAAVTFADQLPASPGTN